MVKAFLDFDRDLDSIQATIFEGNELLYSKLFLQWIHHHVSPKNMSRMHLKKRFWSVMWSKNIYYLDCPLGQVVWRQLNLENLELKYRKYRERIEKRVGHMIWIESLRTCGVRFGLCHILGNKLIRQFQNLESKHHDQSNGNQQKLLFQVVMHHWLNLEEHLYSKHLLKLHIKELKPLKK